MGSLAQGVGAMPKFQQVRHLRKNPFSLLTVLMTFVLVIGACSSGGEATGESGENDENRLLTVRLNADPETFQWAFSTNSPDQPGSVMAISLVSLDIEGQPIPRLAESWEVSGDRREYTFHLAEWTWSDGTPITSDDVKFSIEKVLIPHNPWGSSSFANVTGIATPDDRTVVIKLKQPQDLFQSVSHDFGSIVPKHVYEGTEIPKNPANKDPVVGGPYMLGEYSKGSHVTLVRNPEWAGETTYFDEITFRIIQEEEAAVTALRTGEIDLIPQEPAVGPRDVAAFRDDESFQVVETTSPFGEQDTLLFNTLTPPLDDPKVRQAIAMAIDRQAIIDAVFVGNRDVATGHVSHLGTLSRFATENFLSGYSYDPEKAKQMLDEAGYPEEGDARFRLKMIVPEEFPAPQIQDAIAGYLKDVGIQLQGEVADFATNWSRVFEWNESDPWSGFNMSLMPGMWTAPENIEAYYHSDRFLPGTLWSNAWAYRNTQVDGLIKEVLSSAGTGQAEALADVQRKLAQDLPTFPLTSGVLFEVAKSDLSGLPMGAGLHLEPPLRPFAVTREE